MLSHWLKLAAAGDHGGLVRSGAELTFSAPYLGAHPEMASACEITDLASCAAMAAACRRHDVRDRLAEVTAPTLLLSGESDRVVGPEAADQLATLLPQSQHKVLRTGHIPHWERPAETVAVITGFLAEVEDSRVHR